MANWIRVNRYWAAQKHGPRNYTAHRRATNGTPGVVPCGPETRFYFSREALERDFGPIKFHDEKTTTQHTEGSE